MENSINILHLTDFHIKEENKEEVKQRVDALIKYLIKEKEDIDLLALTGDLAFSGKKEEYQLFENYVLKPLKSQLKINDAKILLLPGNHDVNREAIGLHEHEKTRLFNESRDAEIFLTGLKEPIKRLENYYEYHKNYSLIGNETYSYKEHFHGLLTTRKLNIKGILIGIACFNTAWLCADNHDKNKLFITSCQYRNAVELLEDCNIKLALCHHPFEWLHECENEILTTDIKREFQLILSGHLHQPFSISETTTSFQTLIFTGRAFHEGKRGAEVDDGFHIYKIYASQSSVEANFKKYIRRRNTYDGDNDHAQQGRHIFQISVPLAIDARPALLAQKLAGENAAISSEVFKVLSNLQGTDNPVFVTPKMRSFKFKEGQRKTINNKIAIQDVIAGDTIICGPQDVGKTILLKTIVSRNHDDELNKNSPAISIYLATCDIPSDVTKESLVKLVELKTGQDSSDFANVKLLICADSPPNKSSEFTRLLVNLCKDYKWNFCAVVGNLIADSLAQDAEYDTINFVEICPWGPSRIREFADKLFTGTEIDAEAAYKFVSECIRTVDLPATPTVISLYMSIFPKAGSGFSSLSFLRLLEKIEQIRLGISEPSSVESLYNRRKILQKLAIECLDSNDIYVDQEKILSMVKEYFVPKRLEIDPHLFTQNLIHAGILRAENNEIGFSHFAFFDYYMALAFKDGYADPLLYVDTLEQCGRVAHALSLFAGLERENLKLAERLLDAVEKRFVASDKLRLRDLDAHISDLILPESRRADDADKVATENLESKRDYDAEDEDYEKQKRSVSSNRKSMMSKGRDHSADELSMQISGLHSFYSIFKNLENIDGDWKEIFLDRIIDFHITTNFTLIDFYFQFSRDEKFRTFAAYILTWTGHGFMSSSLGNPSLCQTICDVILKSDNDFKKFLLLLLLSDLRDPRALSMIQGFVNETESRAATEILFIHMRQRLIDYEGKDIPISLINLFKIIFVKRQTKFGGSQSQGKTIDSYNKALKEVKIEHWKSFSSKNLES